MGDYNRCVIKEDTRSIGYSSSARSKAEAVLILQAAFQKIRVYSPPQVDRMWGIWGSYDNILRAIFYLLTGDSGA